MSLTWLTCVSAKKKKEKEKKKKQVKKVLHVIIPWKLEIHNPGLSQTSRRLSNQLDHDHFYHWTLVATPTTTAATQAEQQTGTRAALFQTVGCLFVRNRFEFLRESNCRWLIDKRNGYVRSWRISLLQESNWQVKGQNQQPMINWPKKKKYRGDFDFPWKVMFFSFQSPKT